MKKYFSALQILLFFAWPSFAADLNGYTAQYECRAGGPNCNVDVATLTAAACAQTITTADSEATIESKLNTGSSPICVTNGDYTAKGQIDITASGTSGAYRVMRYFRASDNDDEPWNQSGANQAIFKRIMISGSFWIIHRITINRNDGAASESLSGSADNILSRVLMQNSTGWHFAMKGARITVQNSVIRKTGDNFNAGSDEHCLSYSVGTIDSHVVNNEIYDCTGDGMQAQNGAGAVGMVVENNDFYVSPDYYSDGNGNLTPSGTEACAENALDIKRPGAIATNPAKIIHNRFWGFKRTDSLCGGTGSAGEAIIVHGDLTGASDYVLVQNNIFMDSPRALGMDAEDAANVSFIGNIGYNMRQTGSGTGAFFSMSDATNSEFYLNSLVIAEDAWGYVNGSNNDIRCNVIIDSPPHGSGPRSGVQVDFNVYYGVSGTKIDTKKIDKTLNTRANSTAYTKGDIIRTSTNPTTACTATNNSSACFLYLVTTPGTSASSNPGYCNTLGCTQQDGMMQVRAIRGPYTFFRKLRTSPESYTIPYVRVYASTTNPLENSPDAFTCPSDYNTRPGIGIN